MQLRRNCGHDKNINIGSTQTWPRTSHPYFSKKFKSDIKEWNKFDVVDQTWNDFEIHFTEAYKNLRDNDDLIINKSIILNQTHLVEEIMHVIQRVR